MYFLGIMDDIKDAWNSIPKTFDGFFKLVLAIIFLVISIMILASIFKKKTFRWLEVAFWIIWIVLIGWGFYINFKFSSIFTPGTYISVGITIFILARLLYLLLFYKRGK